MKKMSDGLVAAVFALTALSVMAAEESPVVGKGFAGMIKGKVAAKDGPALIVEVTSVAKTWQHNKMDDPQSLVGKKVRVLPAKKSPNVVKYAETLKIGDSDSFDVRQDGKVMVWLELTQEQRARVGDSGKEKGGGDKEKKGK